MSSPCEGESFSWKWKCTFCWCSCDAGICNQLIRTRRMWVWVNSGNWWWTGRPGVLRFMGSHRVRHDWGTELNWTELNWNTYIHSPIVTWFFITRFRYTDPETLYISESSFTACLYAQHRVFVATVPSRCVSHVAVKSQIFTLITYNCERWC